MSPTPFDERLAELVRELSTVKRELTACRLRVRYLEKKGMEVASKLALHVSGGRPVKYGDVVSRIVESVP